MRELIEPLAARQLIAAHLPAVPVVDCPLDKCAGRILREQVVADRPFPPFDRSMMDGYALRAVEVAGGALFDVAGEASAGAAQTVLGTEAGSCVEIMTGAVLPEGADCVVPYENTERAGERGVRISDPGNVRPGDFVHRKGSDFPQGEVLLEPGRVLGSREIAAAATCGYAALRVTKLPSVAIACSGDELVDVDERPGPQQIRRSNDYAVETALARAHLHAALRTHLPDDPERAREAVTALVDGNDFVLISGGISRGKKDFLPGLLDEAGLKCRFHGVAQKPGKPMGFWSSDRCAVFALPGNPLSTLTCLHHYVLPAMREAMGRSGAPGESSVALTSSENVRGDLTVFLPVSLGAGNRAAPCPVQNSGDLVRILESDGYIAVPAGEAVAEEGRSYAFHPWY